MICMIPQEFGFPSRTLSVSLSPDPQVTWKASQQHVKAGKIAWRGLNQLAPGDYVNEEKAWNHFAAAAAMGDIVGMAYLHIMNYFCNRDLWTWQKKKVRFCQFMDMESAVNLVSTSKCTVMHADDVEYWGDALFIVGLAHLKGIVMRLDPFEQDVNHGLLLLTNAHKYTGHVFACTQLAVYGWRQCGKLENCKKWCEESAKKGDTFAQQLLWEMETSYPPYMPPRNYWAHKAALQGERKPLFYTWRCAIDLRHPQNLDRINEMFDQGYTANIVGLFASEPENEEFATMVHWMLKWTKKRQACRLIVRRGQVWKSLRQLPVHKTMAKTNARIQRWIVETAKEQWNAFFMGFTNHEIIANKRKLSSSLQEEERPQLLNNDVLSIIQREFYAPIKQALY